MRGASFQEISIPAPADDARWVREVMRLRYVFAGIALFAIRRPALILDAPFNQINGDPTRPPPPPREFPAGVEAMRIHSCPLLPTVRRIALFTHAIRYIPAQYDHLYLQVSGSFEQYLDKFSSKTRWTFRKKLKRFMEGGGADGFREYCDAPAMHEFYALSSAVSRKTYQQRLLDAGIPQGKSFPVELERRAAKGQVRGYVLLHKHVPVAYGLCYVHGDTLTLDKMGFDPDYAYTNAGTVLTYFIIQRLFAAQQFRIFDFGSGHYEYKALFATNSVRCADVIFMRPTLLNLTTALSHSGLNTISELLKHLLEVFGLKARVRRLIHRRL